MKLYLIQHAEAFSSDEYAERPLTEQGYLNAQKVAAQIKLRNLPVEALWHSGKTRALQTAKIFHAAFQCKTPPQIHHGLSPKDDPLPIAREIQKFDKDLLIVAHLPLLSRLAARLLTGNTDAEPVAFQNAGLVCLQLNEKSIWQVRWILTPELCREGAAD